MKTILVFMEDSREESPVKGLKVNVGNTKVMVSKVVPRGMCDNHQSPLR